MHAYMIKSDEVIFVIRKLMACSPNGSGGTMSYEENFIKYAGPGELKLLSRGFSEEISLHLTQKRIPFTQASHGACN